MGLTIPTIDGPVSELTTSLRISGVFPGAKVTVNSVGSNSREIGTATASGTGQAVIRFAAMTLQADDQLVAQQSLDGELSEPTPASMAMPVIAVPRTATGLGYVATKTHLYVCGRYVWVTGALPGAEVVIEFNGAVQGSAVAKSEGARLRLQSGLPDTGIRIYQRTPYGSGPALEVPPDYVDRPGATLPSPQLSEELGECQQSIPVVGVFEGATVTVTGKLAGAPYSQDIGFDLDGLWLRLPKPLALGDELTLSQRMDERCELRSAPSAAYKVKQRPLLKPKIDAIEFVVSSRVIPVSNLEPGAEVVINANDNTYRAKASLDSTTMQFMIPALTGGTVTVTQSLCGKSATSNPVPVVPAKGPAVPPKLGAPISPCASFVQWSQTNPLWPLVVMRKDRVTSQASEISSRGIFPSWFIDLKTFPKQDDELWIRQWAPGDVVLDSDPVRVGLPQLPSAMFFNPVRAHHTEVYIVPTPREAVVSVFVETPDGPRFLGAGQYSFPILPYRLPLIQGSVLRAYARLCGNVSQWIETVVRRPPPAKPEFLRLVPLGGGQYHAYFKDPLAGTSQAAEGFQLIVRLPGASQFEVLYSALPTPDAEFDGLRAGTTYEIIMTALADEISSEQEVRQFTTPAPPPPSGGGGMPGGGGGMPGVGTSVRFYVQLDPINFGSIG
jgi:hypothetical protein